MQLLISSIHTCIVFHQILDYLIVSIKASCSQRGGVGLGGGVDIGSTLDQQLHNVQVTGSSCTPERWSALYCLPVKCDGSRLLHAGAALVHEILDHIVVTIATGENQGRGSVGLGGHQPRDLLSWSVVQEYLQQTNNNLSWNIL